MKSMICQMDNYIVSDENTLCRIDIFSAIGQRDEQQDCAGFVLLPDSSLTVVCDGMGGLSAGKISSSHVVERITKAYEDCSPLSRPKRFLLKAVATLDSEVHSLCDEKGNRINSGTTLVAAVAVQKTLHWMTVGDSRIYCLRNGCLEKLSCDHTYGEYLKEAYKDGQITEESYQQEIIKGAGLISFIGIGNLKIIDCDTVSLMSGDRILLMSDGMYKYIPEDVIASVIDTITAVEDVFHTFDSLATQFANKNNIERDNSTIAILSIK